MAKLFALEEVDENKDNLAKNELLIDKVLKYQETDKTSPMSLTSQVLQQRQELKAEINKELNKPPEEDENNDDSSGDNSNDNNSGDNNDSNTENSDNQDGDKGNSDAGGNTDKQNSDGNQDGNNDDSAVADDKDSLKSLIGSGNAKNEDKKTEDDKGNKEAATESFKPRVTFSNIFNKLINRYNAYSVSLEAYNLTSKKLSLEEQPIAYVKEDVVDSFNNIVTLATTYIANNNTFIEKNVDSVKDINEKFSIFRQFVENEKFHFTNKLISDKDILSNVACPEKSDLVETARILLNYIEDSARANNLVSTNDFTDLQSAYANQNFETEGADLIYKTALPGFNNIRLHLEHYRDYIKTDIQEYQYYKLKVLKTEDLYNLNAISINEDRELNRLLDVCDKIIVNISLTTDNLHDINQHFTKFIDEIKVIMFDLDKDKFKDLASINIDSKIKDFIKFKLIIESSYINMNMMIDYLVNVITVINECVELKD